MVDRIKIFGKQRVGDDFKYNINVKKYKYTYVTPCKH